MDRLNVRRSARTRTRFLKGLPNKQIGQADVFYNQETDEFILPYDTVRTADDPDGTLLEFLTSTYAAAATTAIGIEARWHASWASHA